MEVHVIEAGGGVAAPPECFDASVEFPRTQALAAFEHHVFQEMGETFFPRVFEGTAGATPEIEAGQAYIVQRGEHTATAVVQRVMGQFRTVRGVDQDPVS